MVIVSGDGCKAPVTIGAEPLISAAAKTLISELNSVLEEQYPNPDQRHFNLTESEVAGGFFLIARQSDDLVGCIAMRLVDLPDEFARDVRVGEIKRMYVRPAYRSLGVGRQLLRESERRAQGLGYGLLVLETGVKQAEAMGLYRSQGWTERTMYGEYKGGSLEEGGVSICFEKAIQNEKME